MAKRGRPKRRELTKHRVDIQDRRNRVMELARAGNTLSQIAKLIGVTSTTIDRDIKAQLKAAAAACPKTSAYRHLQRERYEALLVAVWDQATSGDLDAVAAARRILARIDTLLGVEVPKKIQAEIAGVDGGPIEVNTKVEICARLPDNGRDPVVHAKDITSGMRRSWTFAIVLVDVRLNAGAILNDDMPSSMWLLCSVVPDFENNSRTSRQRQVNP